MLHLSKSHCIRHDNVSRFKYQQYSLACQECHESVGGRDNDSLRINRQADRKSAYSESGPVRCHLTIGIQTPNHHYPLLGSLRWQRYEAATHISRRQSRLSNRSERETTIIPSYLQMLTPTSLTRRSTFTAAAARDTSSAACLLKAARLQGQMR